MYNQIENDLKTAMKAADKFKVSVLRMLKSNLQAEKINKKCDLTEAEVISVIKKQVKVRRASKEEYLKYNRQDLADSLEQEIAILKKYLPEELTKEELDAIIDEVFATVKPQSIKDMKKVMQVITPLVSSRADMGDVSKKIKEKLAN